MGTSAAVFAVEDAAASSCNGCSMARLATLVPARVPVSEAVIGCVLEVCPETGVGLIAAAVGDLGDGKGAKLRAMVCVCAIGAAATASGRGRDEVATAFSPGLPSLPAIVGDGATTFGGKGEVTARETSFVSTVGAAFAAFCANCPEETVFTSLRDVGTLTLTLAGVATDSREMVCVSAIEAAATALGNDGEE